MNFYCFLNGCSFDQVGTPDERALPQRVIYIVGLGTVRICPRHIEWIKFLFRRDPLGRYVINSPGAMAVESAHASPHFGHMIVTARPLR